MKQHTWSVKVPRKAENVRSTGGFLRRRAVRGWDSSQRGREGATTKGSLIVTATGAPGRVFSRVQQCHRQLCVGVRRTERGSSRGCWALAQV